MVDGAAGLAHHLGHSQLLQVEDDEGAGAHVVPCGHHSTVKVPGSQGPEDLRVPGISGGGVGHRARHLLDPLLPQIHRHHFVAQGTQLTGQRCAESAQSDHQKAFHRHLLQPIITSTLG